MTNLLGPAGSRSPVGLAIKHRIALKEAAGSARRTWGFNRGGGGRRALRSVSTAVERRAQRVVARRLGSRTAWLWQRRAGSWVHGSACRPANAASRVGVSGIAIRVELTRSPGSRRARGRASCLSSSATTVIRPSPQAGQTVTSTPVRRSSLSRTFSLAAAVGGASVARSARQRAIRCLRERPRGAQSGGDRPKHAHGEEEAGVSRRDPVGAALGERPSRHHTVQVRMEREGLARGVEDGGLAEFSAEVLRIASKDLARLARREPILLDEELTLGAVAVATGVVDGTPMPAAVTRIEVTAQGGGRAGRERAQDLLLEEAHRVGGAVARPVPADDRSQVGRGRVSGRSRRLRRGAHAASDREEVQHLRDMAGGSVHRLREMQGARRSADVLVPEQTLHGV